MARLHGASITRTVMAEVGLAAEAEGGTLTVVCAALAVELGTVSAVCEVQATRADVITRIAAKRLFT